MNQKIKNAINEYVLLLPDLYSSPNDHSRLVKIAYEIEINDGRFNDDFDQFFIEALTKRFSIYTKEAIIDFYNDRKQQIENYAFVIYVLKEEDLLK